MKRTLVSLSIVAALGATAAPASANLKPVHPRVEHCETISDRLVSGTYRVLPNGRVQVTLAGISGTVVRVYEGNKWPVGGVSQGQLLATATIKQGSAVVTLPGRQRSDFVPLIRGHLNKRGPLGAVDGNCFARLPLR